MRILALVFGLCLSSTGCPGRDYTGVHFANLEVYLDEEDPARIQDLTKELQAELSSLDPAALLAQTRAEFPERDAWPEGGPVAWEGFRLEIDATPLPFDEDLRGTGAISGPNAFLGEELSALPDGVSCLALIRLGVSQQESEGLPGHPTYLPVQMLLSYHESSAPSGRACEVLHYVLQEEVVERVLQRLGEEGVAARAFLGMDER